MRHTIVLSLTLALALSGCRSAPVPVTPTTPDTASTAFKQIYGVVTWHGPLAAATVNVMDLNGTLLGTTQTNDKGGFVLPLDKPPADYRVVVSGGTALNTPFNGTLQAEARNRPVTQAAVQVNPVTTLISLDVQATPGLTAEAATTQVKAFLELPPSITTFGIALTPSMFNTQQFAQEAEQAGGSTLFLKTLLTELKSGKTHPFKRPLLTSGGDDVAEGIASKIFTGIGNGILGAVGGEIGNVVLGQFMSLVGLGGSSAESMHKEEMDALNKISGQIDQLSTQVANAQAELDLRIANSEYQTLQNTRVAPLLDHNQTVLQMMSDIEAITGDTDADKEARKIHLANLSNYIADNMIVKASAMVEWNAAMTGVGLPGSSDGLLVAWQKLVAQGSPDKWGPEQAKAVQEQWEYFDAQQLQAMVYVINYMKANPNAYPLSTQIKLVNDWQTNRKKQMALIRGNSVQTDTVSLPVGTSTVDDTTTLLALPAGTVVDRNTNVMWTVQPQHWTEKTWFSQPNLPTTRSDQFWDLVYGQAFSDIQRQTGLDGWRFPGTPKRQAKIVQNYYIPNMGLVNYGVMWVPPAELFKGFKSLGIAVKDSDNVVFDLKAQQITQDVIYNSDGMYYDLRQVSLADTAYKKSICEMPSNYSNLTMSASSSFFYGIPNTVIVNGITYPATKCPVVLNNIHTPDASHATNMGIIPWDITFVLQRTNTTKYWYDN